MQKLAWLAWHTLLPWRKKGDKSTPADLLKPAQKKTSNKAITKEEARQELAALIEEMEAR